jgi:uncharacterized protein
LVVAGTVMSQHKTGNTSFDKEAYWKRRQKGLRGQGETVATVKTGSHVSSSKPSESCAVLRPNSGEHTTGKCVKLTQGETEVAGTKDGGKHAATTNKDKYGADFYKKIGAIGGKNGRTGGFYANRTLARAAGALGGRMSRRGKNKLTDKERAQIKEAYKELLAIHKSANKKIQKLDDGAVTVYTRKHGLMKQAA